MNVKKKFFICLLLVIPGVVFASWSEEVSQLSRSILSAQNPVEAIGNVSDIMDVLDLDGFAVESRYRAYREANYGNNAPAIYLNTIDSLLIISLTRMEISKRTRNLAAHNQYLEAMRQEISPRIVGNSDLANAHRTIYGWIEEFRRRL